MTKHINAILKPSITSYKKRMMQRYISNPVHPDFVVHEIFLLQRVIDGKDKLLACVGGQYYHVHTVEILHIVQSLMDFVEWIIVPVEVPLVMDDIEAALDAGGHWLGDTSGTFVHSAGILQDIYSIGIESERDDE